MAKKVLEVRDLRTSFFTEEGEVRAVDGVSFSVEAGKTLGIVGESGCGKSVTSLSIMRLVAEPPGRIVGGQILYNGKDLLKLSQAEMRKVRGNEISMIFQEPMTSLNPVFTIGDQVANPLRNHDIARGAALRSAVVDVLTRVRIPSPDKRLGDYPHQFSGGQRQRVVAAMAIGCTPRLLVADEPTTALDVTIQVQIIALLRQIQADTGTGIILITHDLGVAASLCRRIAVMYAGQIVETGPVRRIYKAPAHPYTQALLAAIPRLGDKRTRLQAIAGQPPSLIDPPTGCRFAARCVARMDKCAAAPPTVELAEGHSAACWKLV